ncbi:mis18-binding protein 1 [Rhincodon typus]|uniref:mis18-binding protein 1 n=1 Tax=Rhincodon typus TaxID=259920 RepID=UPI00202FE953|nr:mis18-binding protein 1 [Rhincodon typus]
MPWIRKFLTIFFGLKWLLREARSCGMVSVTPCKKTIFNNTEMDREQKTAWKSVPLHQIPNGTPLKELHKLPCVSASIQQKNTNLKPPDTFPIISLKAKKNHQVTRQLQSTVLENEGMFHVIPPDTLFESKSIVELNQSYVKSHLNPIGSTLIKQIVSESPAKMFQKMKDKLHCDHLQITENHHLQTPPKKSFGLNGAVASVNGRVIENTFSVPTLPVGCQSSPKKDHAPVMQQSPAKIFLQMKQGNQCASLASVKLSEYKVGFLHSNQHGATFSISSMSNKQPTESIEAPQKSTRISSVDNTVKKTENWNATYLKEDTDNGNEGDNEMSQDVGLNSVSTDNQTNCKRSAIQDFTDVRASSLQKIVHPDSEKMQTRSKHSEKENNDIQECKNLCNILLTSPKINIPRRQEVAESKPEDVDGLKTKTEKRITLTKWIIQQIKGSNEICVEGKRDTDGVYWHSNVIAERIKQTEVKSITGSIYVLKGPLDYVAMKNQGFSNSILKHFFLGFPLDWKEYVEEFFKRREKGCHSNTRGTKDASIQKLPSVKSRNLQDDAVLSHDIAKTQLTAKKKRTKESKIDNEITISTETSIQRCTLTSRSGRCIKAPLEYWRGQRLVIDNTLNVTINEGGTDYLNTSAQNNVEKTNVRDGNYLRTSNQQRKRKSSTEDLNKKRKRYPVLKMERGSKHRKKGSEKSNNQPVKCITRNQTRKQLSREAASSTGGSSLNTTTGKPTDRKYGDLNPTVVMTPICDPRALSNKTVKLNELYDANMKRKKGKTLAIVKMVNPAEIEDTSDSDIFENKSNRRCRKAKHPYELRNRRIKSSGLSDNAESKRNKERNMYVAEVSNSSAIEDTNDTDNLEDKSNWKPMKVKQHDSYKLRKRTIKSSGLLGNAESKRNKERNMSVAEMSSLSEIKDTNDNDNFEDQSDGPTELKHSSPSIKKLVESRQSEDESLETSESVKIKIKRKVRSANDKRCISKRNQIAVNKHIISTTCNSECTNSIEPQSETPLVQLKHVSPMITKDCILSETLTSSSSIPINKEIRKNNTEELSSDNFCSPRRQKVTRVQKFQTPFRPKTDRQKKGLHNGYADVTTTTRSKYSSKLNAKVQKSLSHPIKESELSHHNVGTSALKCNQHSSQRETKNQFNRFLSSDVSETEINKTDVIVKEKTKLPNKKTVPRKLLATDVHPESNSRSNQKKQAKQFIALHSLDSETELWTKKELRCLHRTVSALPKNKHGFWEEVAASVGTHSAEACQQKYLSDHQLKLSKRPNVKQKKNSTSNKNKQEEPVKIIARVGTLKRKQQVRSFLEHLPKEDHEDLFSDTVFQQKQIKLPSFPSSQEDDDDDDFMLQTNPTTPTSVIFPLAKTPQWNHISPRMLGPTNSANNDKYVFQLQKKCKMKNWSKVSKRSKPELCMSPTRSKSPHLIEGAQKSNIGKIFKNREDAQSDDDTEDEDYYFSVTE